MLLNDYLIFIVILASFGNAFVILSLLINQKTRTTFGVFIINIAFIDFLIGAFLKSSFVVEDYFEGQQISGMHCYLMTSFITASPMIKIMIMIVLSLFTLFGSIKKISLDKLLTPENTFVTLLLIWILCGGMSLINHRVLGKHSSSCAVDEELLIISVFAIFLLMGLLIAIHVIIIVIEQVRKVNDTIEMMRTDGVYNNLSVELQREEEEAQMNDKSSKRLIFIISLLFVLFWMPFYSIRAHYEFNDKKHTFDLVIFQLIAYVFGYFNSTVTPIAILVVYPESRILLNKVDWEKFKFWKKF
ncbi:hypothetical protein PVAND_012513 [Polypedilum vanderplanki]|uniref:G-protein coupled receptors family 1 profile domain-containing protein n=1 Tax=Polypedilum vanderplanki TaxID=319348 RepID=A0A9J6CLR8_POLVA|nr:hypothetical protein PVAND_012513 [Polypedilum vanderplanki]